MAYKITQFRNKPLGFNSGLSPVLYATLTAFLFGDSLMKRIDISTKTYPNTFALVDDADFDWLNQYKWHVCCVSYAKRSVVDVNTGKRHEVFMHRLILGLKYHDKRQGDHKNHNGFDNQRQNLRICTRSQNLQNSLKTRRASSKYKGVDWYKRSKKWRAKIMLNYKGYFLGCFIDEIEAAKAYDRKALELFGEFAYLNFPVKEAKK